MRSELQGVALLEFAVVCALGEVTDYANGADSTIAAGPARLSFGSVECCRPGTPTSLELLRQARWRITRTVEAPALLRRQRS